MTEKILCKHFGSCAQDLPLSFSIDVEKSLVEIQVEHFDSFLITHLITRVLPERGVGRAWRDDETGWTPPSSEWQIHICLAGVLYRLGLTKLGSWCGGGWSVALFPLNAQKGPRR